MFTKYVSSSSGEWPARERSDRAGRVWEGVSPLPNQVDFAFWRLKVSDLVHIFGGFAGILSHAHQGVWGGVISNEAWTVSPDRISNIPKTGKTKRGI